MGTIMIAVLALAERRALGGEGPDHRVGVAVGLDPLAYGVLRGEELGHDVLADDAHGAQEVDVRPGDVAAHLDRELVGEMMKFSFVPMKLMSGVVLRLP
jgi:hypothetical protein